jgi:hypothetical protein
VVPLNITVIPFEEVIFVTVALNVNTAELTNTPGEGGFVIVTTGGNT